MTKRHGSLCGITPREMCISVSACNNQLIHVRRDINNEAAVPLESDNQPIQCVLHVFLGRTRRTRHEGDKFKEEEVTIKVDGGDLSSTEQDQNLYVYRHKSDVN